LENTSHLSWVLVNNELHNVKDYAHLAPKKRPLSYCPVCERQVTLKLGTIKVYHAAHKKDDVCPVTNPETALHLNAKLHVAEQLRQGKPIKVIYPCTGFDGKDCDSAMNKSLDYLSGWDDVKVEYSIDQYRPDIVLLKNGESIGAVEVFVTHTIEPEKEKYLNELAIPWIEVDANYILETETGNAWHITDFLQYRKINKTVYNWLCLRCQWKQDEANKPKPIITTTAFRVIDIFSQNNNHTRLIYLAKKSVREGITIELRIEEARYGIQFFVQVSEDIEESRLKIKERFEERIRNPFVTGAIVDASMNWYKVSGKVMENQVNSESWRKSMLDASVHGIFPKKYYWVYSENIWKPIQAFQHLDWNKNYQSSASYLETNKWFIMDAISEITLDNKEIKQENKQDQQRDFDFERYDRQE
jgi:hypothetical protein